MELPERTTEAEDAYVLAMGQGDDLAALEEAITAALDARRPLLAARLIGFLEDHVTIEPGTALHRAQQAARFILVNKPSPADNSWSALDDAWRDTRRRLVRRAVQRQRDRLNGHKGRRSRVPGMTKRRH